MALSRAKAGVAKVKLEFVEKEETSEADIEAEFIKGQPYKTKH